MTSVSEVIQRLKVAGAADDSIVRALVQRGWSEAEAQSAIVAYYLGAAGVEIPAPPASSKSSAPGRGEPLEPAFYATLMISLLVWVYGVVAVAGVLVEQGIGGESQSTGTLSWAIAALIVSSPLVFGFFTVINQRLRRGAWSGRSDARIRWTSAGLIVGAFVFLGTLIGLLNDVLLGRLTTANSINLGFTLAMVAGTTVFVGRWLQRPPAPPVTNDPSTPSSSSGAIAS